MPNAPTPEATGQFTLACVADYLRRNGWKQGSVDQDHPYCCCVMVALYRVLPDSAHIEAATIALAYYISAWKLRDLRLRFDQAEGRVITWNDAPGRVFRDIEVALHHTSYEVPSA